MLKSGIFRNAKLPDGRLTDIAVGQGRITGIGERLEGETAADFSGALVLPGFVEGHIHLDTSFYGDIWIPHKPCTNGFDVQERVKFQKENIAIAAPLRERAINQLELCLAHGSTRMRSHVMVDADVGLSHVEAILDVREAYAEHIEIQLVAFPQSGILASKGAADLLDQAMAMGCDLIGGLDPASIDGDSAAHLDVVFDIAERRGAGVDIHLHDGGEAGAQEIRNIAARAKAAGMEGLVGISHAYALGDIAEDAARHLADELAISGVAIMTTAPGARPFPPVMLLREAGVTVWAGNDNIRDSWSPFGDGDMLRRAMMIGYRSGFRTDEELLVALDLATESAAAALGLADYGFCIGASADFVTLNARHGPEAVASVPSGRQVWRAGRLVAEAGRVIDPPG